MYLFFFLFVCWRKKKIHFLSCVVEEEWNHTQNCKTPQKREKERKKERDTYTLNTHIILVCQNDKSMTQRTYTNDKHKRKSKNTKNDKGKKRREKNHFHTFFSIIFKIFLFTCFVFPYKDVSPSLLLFPSQENLHAHREQIFFFILWLKCTHTHTHTNKQ